MTVFRTVDQYQVLQLPIAIRITEKHPDEFLDYSQAVLQPTGRAPREAVPPLS